jgi:hypothetical protein
MAFIPVMHQPEQPSLQAIELSQRLQQTIAEYQQRNPSLTAEEIRQAAELASRQSGGGAVSRGPLVPLVVAGAAAAILGVGLYLRMPAGDGGAAMVPVAVIAALAAVMIAVVRSRRG